MTLPKKHHYLPQCYLEGFKITPPFSKVPHIWMIPKVSRPEPVSPSIIDTACERGYHDDDTDPNNKDRSSIESAFSKLEHAHAETVAAVVADKRISTAHKESLALFVSIMRCRVPSYKKHIEKVLQEHASSTTRIELRNGRLPPPPSQVAELIAKQGDDIFDVAISNWMLMLQMINAGIRSDAPAILFDMHFSLVEAEDDIGFITCDSPVSHYVPDYEARRPYGVGLVDKEIEVSIPLNTRFLLLLSWQSLPQYQTVDSRRVHEFNRRTIITADRFVYASSVNDGLLREVSRLHERFSRFESQLLDYGRGFCSTARFVPVTGEKV